MSENGNGIGAAVKRREDFRFLTGRGRYTDDINRPGQAFACFVRSPHARATIKSINTAAAMKAPGVAAIYTGKDMAADKVGGIPCGWQIHSKDGSPMKEPPHMPLVESAVCHVGDQVAVVIAESVREAKDAAELVEVDYEVRTPVASMKSALTAKELVHEDAPGNICYDWELCTHEGGKAEVDAEFKKAAHVAKVDIYNNRLTPNAIEPRAAIGEYDAADGKHTLYTTSQNPHVIRLLMGAFVLQIPEHKLRVVAPDVGGGFGSKIYHYAEEAVVTWAAKKVGRPVKWTAERAESFVSDAQGRDHLTHGELAVDKDGKFLALRVETTANMGAYLSTFAPSIPTYLYATLLAGTYATPKIWCGVKAVFTNTVPVDAYRGAGRPEANTLLERLADVAARETGIDRVEIRRRNFISPDAFPYQTPVALQYDSGNFHALLDEALKVSDYAGFSGRKAESAKRGKLRGVGVTTYIEACGLAPSAVAGALGARAGLYESAVVRVNPTGSVQILTGSHSHGQGHETTFAQVVSDRLGVPLESVEIVHGDTDKIPFGMGTYGSRSMAVGGEALARALNKIVEKAGKIAAHMMEADAADVEFSGGKFTVKGTDKSLGFGDVALQAYVPHNFPHKSPDNPDGLEPGLEEQAFYDPLNFTYPSGCYVCEVEVDPETGKADVASFTAVDDVGRIVNPMIVAGQIQGGVAQGIGQALLEHSVFDENGQPLAGSFMDYAMPRASDVPGCRLSNTVTLCTHNSLGVKGCGEAGAIGSPAAVVSALLDALGEKGVTDIDMPATPYRVWSAIQNASA